MRRLECGAALVLLAAHGGCGRYYWSRPGATAEQFTRDSQDCIQDAAGKMPEPTPPGSYRGLEGTADVVFTRSAPEPPRPR